jgi:hypothetical protein
MKRVPSGNQTGQREIPKKIENRGLGKIIFHNLDNFSHHLIINNGNVPLPCLITGGYPSMDLAVKIPQNVSELVWDDGM